VPADLVHGAGRVSVDEIADDLAAAALTMARRFAAGATMWVLAPAWPAHGRHVAVEFVHPVIVGKRALPAVHVDDADLVGAVRLLARPGDLLLAVGGVDDRDLAGVLRRSEAWGVTTLWIGSGPRPASGAADHPMPADDRAIRRLDDGREFTIVKIFYSPAELTAALTDAGFSAVDVTPTGRFFVLGTAIAS